MQTLQVNAPDGQALAARLYVPEGPPHRLVLIAAAMGVPQRFYEPFAQWLSEQGVAVMTFDWRGIGDSRPRHLRGFKASITDWATLDLPAVADALLARWPGVPATFIGHSLGGQLFGMLDGTHRFERVLTVAAGNGYWPLNAKATRWQAPLLWWFLAPVSVALAGYFPGKRLGVVGDLPAAAMMQWRRWCLHPDYVGAEGAQVRARYAAVTTPMTVLLMPDDELLSPQGIRRLYQLYSGAAVNIVQVDARAWGRQHLGHFGLFKRHASSPLWAAMLAWIEGRDGLALAAPAPH
jgi:predicted alpha/beta hydrolase